MTGQWGDVAVIARRNLKLLAAATMIMIAAVSAILLIVIRNGGTPASPTANVIQSKAASSNGVSSLSASEQSGAEEFVPDQVVVRYKRGASGGERRALRRELGARHVRKLSIARAELVTLEPGTPVKATASKLESSDVVEFAEPNYIVRASVTPNDPLYGNLWGLNNTGQTGGTADADIDAPEAWNSYTGGNDVTVAVVDTGVDYNHVDLNDNMWTNSGEAGTKATNGIDDDGNGFVDDWRGYDFANNDGNPIDDNFHGTHVAGTIAGEGNNGVGVTGVSWDANIMPVKFLDSGGSGSLTDGAEALDYAASMGASVVNGSFGYTATSGSELERAVIESHPDTLYVFSAGNNGRNNDGATRNYPCSHPSDNIICVGATWHNDERASFWNWASAYGANSVDVFAPGVDILSTKASALTSEPGDYLTISGTSMAAPHVAGAAAVLKSANPSAISDDLKKALIAGVDAKSSLASISVSGGRLNLNSSLGQIAAIGNTTSVSAVNGRITYRGSNNDAHNVSVSHSGSNVTVGDSTAAVTAGAGCTSVDANQVSCADSGITDLRIVTGNQADVVTINSSLDAYVRTLGGNDQISGGSGDDHLIGGTGSDSQIGGDGVDVADYGDHTAPVTLTLDLSANDGSSGEGDSIDNSIENLTGGSNGDTIVGNGGNNELRGAGGGDSLQGGSGDDALIGGTGADQLIGDGGSDTANYSDRLDDVALSIDGSANDGSSGEGDSIAASVENLRGGGGDDTLSGSTGANAFTGGEGVDTVSYSGRTEVLSLTLDGAPNDGATGEGDLLAGDIENLTGGSGSDTLAGGDGDNVLDGGLGGDTISGGAGLDTVTYAARTAPVTVTLSSGANDGVSGEGDNVGNGVEKLIGGSANDSLTGDSLDNLFDARNGDDTMSGGSGDDTFIKGYTDGADVMIGGDGSDTVDYSGPPNIANRIISLDGLQNDGINGGSVSPYADNVGADVENVVGGRGDDTIYGNGLDNRLLGGEDNSNVGSPAGDQIYGYGGNDFLDGDGWPTYSGTTGPGCGFQNAGSDSVYGGSGNDRLIGGLSSDSNGAPNRDYLYGEDGDDVLSGGVDRDHGGYPCINYDAGFDEVYGGAGDDTADFSRVTESTATSLDDQANDGVIGGNAAFQSVGGQNYHSDIENVTGALGADRIVGSAAANRLDGGEGSDSIDGLTGVDDLRGGNGIDSLKSDDGDAADSVTCGASTDSVQSDAGDSVDPDCEQLGASLAHVEVDNGTLRVTAVDGQSNTYVVSYGDSYYKVDDQKNVLKAGPGCVQYSASTAFCTPVGVTRGELNGGDLNDVLWAVDSPQAHVVPFTLRSGPGDDTLLGGAMNDTLDGGTGRDHFDGYAGIDTATYADRTEPLNLALNSSATSGAAGEQDYLNSSTVENLTGGSGDDTITGNSQNNKLQGGPGSDVIFGLAGDDKLISGDLGTVDSNDCGGGTNDTVVRDPVDSADNCENSQIDDGSSPTLTVSQPAEGAVLASATVNVTFTAGGTAIGADCTLDNAAAVSCSSPYAFTGVSEGSHTLVVTANSAAGSSTSVTRHFTVDSVTPTPSITLSPAGPSSNSAPVATITDNDPAPSSGIASRVCQLDRGDNGSVEQTISPCPSGTAIAGVAEGINRVNVNVTDNAGNVGSTSVTYTLDTVAPNTAIDSGPANGSTTDDQSVTFSYHGSPGADAASFDCRVDSGAWSSCGTGASGSYTTAVLANGSHSFDVRAKDSAGNADASPATRSFTVATTVPGQLTNGGSATTPSTVNLTAEGTMDWAHWGRSVVGDFEHKASGGTKISNYTQIGSANTPARVTATPNYSWSDGTPTASATTNGGIAVGGASGRGIRITAPASQTTRTIKLYVGLAGGSAFSAAGGNLAASLSDGSATAISVNSPTTTSSSQLVYTLSYRSASSSATLTVEWKQSSSGSGHRVRLFAASLAASSDTTPPAAPSITAPAVDDTVVSSPTTAVSFTGEAGASFQCKVAGVNSYASCSSAYTTPSLSDGYYTVRVRAIDAAGNVGPAASRKFYVALPQRSASVSVADAPASLNLTTVGAETTIDWAQWGYNSTSSQNYRNRKSGATDLIGTYTASGTVSRQTTGAPANSPAISWTGGTPTASVSNTKYHVSVPSVNNYFELNVTGSTTNLRTLRLYVGLNQASGYLQLFWGSETTPFYTSPTVQNTTAASFKEYTVSYRSSSATEKLKARWVQSADHGTNRVSLHAATITQNADAAAPETTISSGPANGSVISSTTPQFAFGSSEGGSTFQCRVDSAAFAPCSSPHTTSALAAGEHTFDVRAIDATGNIDPTPARRTFVVDS